MDIRGLKSFITAARCGSFQKASDELFLSSTALINQVNVLEEEIGCKLFTRNNKGIRLTEAGRYFYEACSDIVNRCEDAVQSTYELSIEKTVPVRIGTSLTCSIIGLNPYLAQKISAMKNTNHSSQIIMKHMSDELSEFLNEIRNLGINVDLIPYFLGNTFFSTHSSEFCIMQIPMYIAMSVDHPLHKLKSIHYQDLKGQNLITVSDHVNKYYSRFNQSIIRNAPGTKLDYVSYIDLSVLNEVSAKKHLLLIGGNMTHIHPFLKYIPLDTGFVLPYGFLYSRSPSSAVIHFLEYLKEQGISGSIEDAEILTINKSA